MIKFTTTPAGVTLFYRTDRAGNGWVWEDLQKYGAITIGRTFTFQRADLVTAPSAADAGNNYEEFEYEFSFATAAGGYFRIDGRILGIPNTIFIADKGLRLERKLFIAEHNISIFCKIAEVLASNVDIVIGGEQEGAMPIEVFQDLVRRFPGTTEMTRYVEARVARVVGDYFTLIKDAQGRYEAYLNKTRSVLKGAPLRQPELLQTELEKYRLIRDIITEWLRGGEDHSEDDWQKMIGTFLLLIFPKYVVLLEKVYIQDFYSAEDATTKRFIDLALVDASGNIDVIELKKPFEAGLLSRATYRDNYVPGKELAGSIMQAEKYLFHLSKWGVAGEKRLMEDHGEKLPRGMAIRITNPKAMIIMGRDCRKDGTSALNRGQLLDLEVIKRKYANMMDILTYDDLLRRLNNIIAALGKRMAVEAEAGGSGAGQRAGP